MMVCVKPNSDLVGRRESYSGIYFCVMGELCEEVILSDDTIRACCWVEHLRGMREGMTTM